MLSLPTTCSSNMRSATCKARERRTRPGLPDRPGAGGARGEAARTAPGLREHRAAKAQRRPTDRSGDGGRANPGGGEDLGTRRQLRRGAPRRNRMMPGTCAQKRAAGGRVVRGPAPCSVIGQSGSDVWPLGALIGSLDISRAETPERAAPSERALGWGGRGPAGAP